MGPSAKRPAARRKRAATRSSCTGAHAYLLAQFLSPYSNRRQDDWGGGLENRTRLHREIYRAMRRQIGPEYPVMIKLGMQDGFPGGLEFEEGLEAAVGLADLGYDAIEVSQNLRGLGYENSEFRLGIVKREQEAYFRDWARRVKERVRVPVMSVGGLRSVALMEQIVASHDADFVSLCRPLIREPDLIASWEAGDARQPKCVSCSRCFDHILTGARLECVVETRVKAAQAATAILVQSKYYKERGVMDFELSDAQKDILKAAREFAEGEIAPVAAEYDAREEFPRKLWRKACELGFVGSFIKEEYGGPGLGFYGECDHHGGVLEG